MSPLSEIVLALLTAAGLFTLAWFVFGRLLAPSAATALTVVLPASGAGADLEHDLRYLLWLRSSGLFRGEIVIRDDGLTPAGVALAQELALREGVTCALRDRRE